MSSPYNARSPAAEVLVDGQEVAVIRARPPIEALWANDRIPKSLE